MDHVTIMEDLKEDRDSAAVVSTTLGAKYLFITTFIFQFCFKKQLAID